MLIRYLLIATCLVAPALSAQTEGALTAPMVRKITQSFVRDGSSDAAINLLTANSLKTLAVDRDKLVHRDKLFTFKRWQLELYVDLLNAIHGKNPEDLQYNYDYTEETYIRGLPFIPSPGFQAEFEF